MPTLFTKAANEAEAEQHERARQTVERYRVARYAIGHKVSIMTPDELVSWAALENIVSDNPEMIENANDKIGWFVGQVMKDTGGEFDPEIVQSVVKTKFGIPHQHPFFE